MRWFFYYPTYNKPSGGNKQLRLMASLLAELGVETALIRDRRYFDAGEPFDDNRFYGVALPVASFPFDEAGHNLGPEDVVILPEGRLEQTLAVCQGWSCRLAVNNQNGFYALSYRPPPRVCRSVLEFAIANAPYVAAICRDFLGLPPERIFQVPHWILRPPFELLDGQPEKKLAVCFMPRKLPGEVRAVRARVEQTHPDVPWVEIDGLPEADVARKFREHAVVFTAQDWEGCPFPALEAMACDCLVAGFPGTARFPHPYASAANGFWAPDRNVEAAAGAVGAAIDVFRAGGGRYTQYLDAGRQTARRFSREAVREALVEMIRTVESGNYGTRRNAIPGLGWRGRLQAYRLLYDSDRLGWPGRVAGRVAQVLKPFRRARVAPHTPKPTPPANQSRTHQCEDGGGRGEPAAYA
jgi:hypothetical protein